MPEREGARGDNSEFDRCEVLIQAPSLASDFLLSFAPLFLFLSLYLSRFLSPLSHGDRCGEPSPREGQI